MSMTRLCFVAASCLRWSNLPLTSKPHLSTRGSLTRTRQGTVTPATWISTAARRYVARSTSHATTSSGASSLSAPTSGWRSGTPNVARGPSREGSNVFQCRR